MKYNVDNLISDSKDILDKLSDKASGAVSVSKAYIEKAQLRVKLRDMYYKLGKTCYDMHQSGSDETGNMKKLIKEIKILEAELEYAEEASGKPRECKFCGARNISENIYCSKCGEKLR